MGTLFYSISHMRWQDAVDILILTSIFYYIFLLIRETRAMQMLRGVLLVFAVTLIAKLLKIYTLTWLLQNLWIIGVVALVIIFQPEMRQILIDIGQKRWWKSSLFMKREKTVFNHIVEAARQMAKRKIGGLIVIERETNLRDYMTTGTILDSKVSSELLVAIFIPKGPLHDGAVIIKNSTIAAAGCMLPLSQNPTPEKELGMRHRAAMGLSEETDALVVIVSEEQRTISLALGGKITPPIDAATLEEMLVLYTSAGGKK